MNVPRLSDSRSSSPFDLTQVSSGSSNEIAIAAPGMRNPSPKPKPSSEIIAASTKTRKRKEDDDPLNAALTAAIVKDINKSGEDTNDSDLLFCKSLVAPLKQLSSKKNKRARIKLLEVLMSFDIDDE